MRFVSVEVGRSAQVATDGRSTNPIPTQVGWVERFMYLTHGSDHSSLGMRRQRFPARLIARPWWDFNVDVLDDLVF